MTPPAATQAAQTGAKTVAPPHRRTVRPVGPAPRGPRRVSGPVRAAVAEPQRLIPPVRGPATRPSTPKAPRRTAAPATVAPGLPLHAKTLAFIRSMPDQRWLDRLVRGRVWIPLLGVLLTGVVAMQVEVLKLGTSVGRSLSLATELQSRNELLRSSVAQLSDDQRIAREAAKLGMVMPGPTEVQFVPANGRNRVGKAIAGIHGSDAQTFLSALAAQESADGVANPSLGTSSGAGAAAPAPTAPTTAAPTTTTAPTVAATPTGATVSPTAQAPAPTATPTGATAVTPVAPAPAPAATPPAASSPATGGAAAG